MTGKTSYGYDKRELMRKRRQEERRRQVRKRAALLVLGIMLAAGLSLSYHAVTSRAGSGADGIRVKYYKSVSVGYGETLWSIAQQYGGGYEAGPETYICEVMSINHLQTEEIAAGQYLVVPYYSQEFPDLSVAALK